MRHLLSKTLKTLGLLGAAALMMGSTDQGCQGAVSSSGVTSVSVVSATTTLTCASDEVATWVCGLAPTSGVTEVDDAGVPPMHGPGGDCHRGPPPCVQECLASGTCPAGTHSATAPAAPPDGPHGGPSGGSGGHGGGPGGDGDGPGAPSSSGASGTSNSSSGAPASGPAPGDTICAADAPTD